MYQLDKEAFGEFLQGLRKEKGLTQRQLAEALHISDKAVSKWERGLSIPDTGLLLPLAEELGVTVTELLLCRRCSPAQSLEPDTVEQAVQAAIHYPGHQSLDRAWRHLDRRSLWYFGALAASAGLMVLLAGRVPGAVYGQLQVMTLLAAVFGGYFWLAAPVRLPPLYDEHELSFFADGPFRMNMAGVRFHNGNWPHLLRTLRLWSCLALVGTPLVLWTLAQAVPKQVLLVGGVIAYLAGLFLPVYLTAWRHR